MVAADARTGDVRPGRIERGIRSAGSRRRRPAPGGTWAPRCVDRTPRGVMRRLRNRSVTPPLRAAIVVGLVGSGLGAAGSGAETLRQLLTGVLANESPPPWRMRAPCPAAP